MCLTPAHMAVPNGSRPRRDLADTELARWLRGQLDEQGLGIRTLAKKMNPADPEVPRRALNRVLYEGAMPSDANRRLIAVGLGVSPEELPSEDDEEPG